MEQEGYSQGNIWKSAVRERVCIREGSRRHCAFMSPSRMVHQPTTEDRGEHWETSGRQERVWVATLFRPLPKPVHSKFTRHLGTRSSLNFWPARHPAHS